MFTPLVDHTSGRDFSELGKFDKLTWNQFHIENWGARDFEGHALLTMHNKTGREVPLTWILLNRKSTVDLILNAKMSVKIRKVGGKTP